MCVRPRADQERLLQRVFIGLVGNHAQGGVFERPAAGADFLGHSQRSHSRAAAGVNNRFFQSIVIVKAVRQGAIGQNRIRRRHF